MIVLTQLYSVMAFKTLLRFASVHSNVDSSPAVGGVLIGKGYKEGK